MTPQQLKQQGPVPKKKMVKERITDKMAASLCILYLLLMLAFLTWQLFDTWIGRYSLLVRLGYGLQSQQTLRLIAFTLLAGALGGVVNGLRSTLHYHRDGFDRRHTWKYLCAPWMGATLALFVYALLRSSIAVLGGNVAGNVGTAQVLSNFSAGALVGYGSKDVFVWLDAKVQKFFEVSMPGKKQKRKKASSKPAKNGKRLGTAKHASPRAARIDPLMNRRGGSVPMTVASNGKAN